jgi:hypothetical protein
VAEIEIQKEEMLKLIMEQNAQIREMEAKKNKLIKEKDKNAHLAMIPLDAVPLTGIRIEEVSTSTSIPTQSSDASNKLVKSMEDMSIQGVEIKKLQEEVKSLQEQKSMVETCHQKEMHKYHMLNQRLQQLGK